MESNIIKLKLKRIDPVKYATISAFITVLLMLIIFVPIMLLFSVAGLGASDFGSGAAIFGGGIIAIIFVPILYGVLVFIVTLIAAYIMNFALKKTGGLEVDFEKTGLDISFIGKE